MWTIDTALAKAQRTALVASLGACSVLGLPAAEAAPSTFDGRWSVSLVCDDVRENGVFAKGYTFKFLVDVQDGRLSGQYGEKGQPSSLALEGRVDADGSLDLIAQGRTGKSEYTVGRVQPSTPYSYRMKGQLTGSTGRAARIELRPCLATFER